ncbi:DNA binding protein [Streptomyces phage Danzina]|uniref:DNA binding protein n=3 Tax=Likavirus TaxID=1982880 RepID=A0A291AVN7_9CAUD|nr:DNA binding protein [Streptomyces phage Zemlya]YP_009592394.1 hypothetical protein FDG70_gp29 [Streptomyces phage Danzina]AGM12204.1 DNA binding protein [Streptomyces phage Zemlya]AKY03484.1 DNA binding protein [Streptomyces phage Danzina]ATE85056.1 DNA binding protein [Streptomyces phage Celeste]
MKIEITVCDLDQAVGVPTKHYTLGMEGRTVELDLCDEHARPIVGLMGVKHVEAAPRQRTAVTTTKKRTAPRARPKIVSLEDIEAMKQ